MNDPELVGKVNTVNIIVNNIPATALLDTGSCVSVLSESFYKEHFSDIDIQALDDLIRIECADGQLLPYLGYIEVEISAAEGFPRTDPVMCLLLITPDTNYSSNTPIILGTNILQEFLNNCKDSYGNQFLQKANLFTPWYLSFRTMVLRDKELKRNHNRIAIIRSSISERILLKPNETIQVKGFIDREMNYPTTTAIIQESEEAGLPEYIDVSPAVIQYQFGKNHEVMVTLSNLTTNTAVITPKLILCELQPVEVTEDVFEKLQEENQYDLIDTLSIDEENLLKTEQREQLKDLLKRHGDMFSRNETDI